ncbi:MAG: MATE family efflux transporter [Lachnospiraceae bacterium]|nr:MATE family efflux transporter [Lachnospiraceae bacterium]
MRQGDMTKGPVFRTITVFALPMLLGNMLQQMYNVIDTWVVGNFIGSDALAGVGSAYTLMIFLTSILLGLCMGSGVVFSLCFGQKDEQKLKESVRTAFLLIAAVTVLLAAIPILALDNILAWINIPQEILTLTKKYLFIVFLGIPAVFVYNFFAAYLKALGNAVVPLIFLGLSTAVNIAFDLLFVVVFRWGTSGAAGATILAQYISGIGVCAYVLKKDSVMRSALGHMKLNHKGIREIAGYSVFTCLQQSVMNLGILMVQGLVNSFGTTIMAAFAAAVKIDSFAYMPAQEYGNAFSTFVAQNMGANKKKRVVNGIKCAALTSITYCVAASFILRFQAKNLMQIFISASETVIVEEGVRYLHIEGAFYCGIGCLFLLYGFYRATAKPAMSLVLTVISLGTRVALAYLLSPISSIGVTGIWWAIPIGWFLADTVGIVYLIVNRKKILPVDAVEDVKC